MPAHHFYLSLHILSSKFFSSIILSITPHIFLLGILGFLLPGSFQFVTCFGIRVSGILWTCLYHMNYLFFISSTIVCVTCIIVLIRSFLTLLSLNLSAAFPQKSISAASNIRFVVSLIGHISQLYVIIKAVPKLTQDLNLIENTVFSIDYVIFLLNYKVHRIGLFVK